MLSSEHILAVDAHVAGGVLRLVTEGVPAPHGRTAAEKARWLDRRYGARLSALTREPRGHDGLVLGILAEPSADADAALLLRTAAAAVPLDGRALIAAAVVATRSRLIVPRRAGMVRLETSAGPFDLQLTRGDADVVGDGPADGARYVGPAAFVLAGGVPVALSGRSVRVDIAWCGQFHAFVDSESVGLPVLATHEPELRRTARAIAAAIASTLTLAHPLAPTAEPLGSIGFTAPAADARAHLRVLSISPDGLVTRGPSAEGLTALLAVLDAMGLASDQPLAIETLDGTPLQGRIVARPSVGELDAIQVEIAASAWVVAEHRFVFEAGDPLG